MSKTATRARGEHLTDAERQRIVGELVGMLRCGVPLKAACAKAGVHRKTVYGWMERHEMLRDAIENARGEAESMLVQRIDAASLEDWKAAAWLLEKRFPKRYGKVERREITGAGGGPQKVDAVVTIEGAKRIARGDK